VEGLATIVAPLLLAALVEQVAAALVRLVLLQLIVHQVLLEQLIREAAAALAQKIVLMLHLELSTQVAVAAAVVTLMQILTVGLEVLALL